MAAWVHPVGRAGLAGHARGEAARRRDRDRATPERRARRHHGSPGRGRISRAGVAMTMTLPGLDYPAPAKLNLFLHVVGRRADGYHLLQSVFTLLDYGDNIRLRVRDDGQVRRVNDLPGIPEAEDLTVRAAQMLREASGTSRGADIEVEKRIPLGGGLGGGSSDAATVLLALDRLWGTGFGPDALAELGAGLGADIPFFIRGATAWAEGVGEKLHPIAI